MCGISNEEATMADDVEDFRKELPARTRVYQIIQACRILKAEGYGHLTPDELSKIVAEVLSRARRET